MSRQTNVSRTPRPRYGDSRLPYPARYPHTFPGRDYHYHYYPPPPYTPAYVGPPPRAFTPCHPESSRDPQAQGTPLTITPHDAPPTDWIPECITSPEKSYRYEEYEPTVTGSGSSESESQNRPTPAKSAFVCFMQAKSGGNANDAAEAWRHVSKEEKLHWESVANKDRKRYHKERGEMQPFARKVRRKKDPSAPKRPMSAFLMYAQTKRRQLQAENPDIPNADISRLLGEHWRNSSPEEKAPFVEREEVERGLYKAKMERWKNDVKLAKSLAPRVHGMAMPVSTHAERYDQRQDDEEPLAFRVETRYASPPSINTINEFGAAYPVEASYLNSPYGGYHSGDRHPVLTPMRGQGKKSPYWESPYKLVDSAIKFSYPRPDEEGNKEA